MTRAMDEMRLMRAAPALRAALVELTIAARWSGSVAPRLLTALEGADAVLRDTAPVQPRRKPGPKPTSRPKTWAQLELQALD